MKKVAIFLVFAFFGFGANAQTEEELVLKSIHQLFDAMRASDAEKLSEVLHPEIQMRTAMINV
jgi:hypothetical protein